jgi:hypothetical protein
MITDLLSERERVSCIERCFLCFCFIFGINLSLALKLTYVRTSDEPLYILGKLSTCQEI